MNNTEKIIWTLIQQKDAEAFEDYYKEHYKSFFLMAYKYLKSEVLAQEVVNDVFVKIWEEGSRMVVDSSLKSYLYKAVINSSINLLNRQKRERQNRQDLIDRSSDSYELREMEENEMKIRIYAAIDQLPQQCRKVFQMSRFEGLKNQEVADKLGISIKTVKNHITHALKQLGKSVSRTLVLIIIEIFFVRW
jgi:RNA polymerase sigma-70 factor (family 1)